MSSASEGLAEYSRETPHGTRAACPTFATHELSSTFPLTQRDWHIPVYMVILRALQSMLICTYGW